MLKKLLFATACTALAAPALAESQSYIGVSYMGSVNAKIKDMGVTEDLDFEPQGGRAVFHIQTPNYFFWGLEADYGSDSDDNYKEEITNVKIKFGGRIPAGDQWGFRPYIGGTKQEFRGSESGFDEDDVIKESGVLLAGC